MAIKERRTLGFDAQEIVNAIKMVPQIASAIGLPSTNIMGVEFEPEAGLIKFHYDDGERTLSAEPIAAVLVAYCLRLNIPLPRYSEKSMEITTEEVMLTMTTERCANEQREGVESRPVAMIWKKRYPR